jgi:ATP-binding cassette subfamily B protein RaxB
MAALAQMADGHENVMMMLMGYNGLIGNMGNSPSGGQKQRFPPARAL